jgi:hypothetical protein
MSMQRSFNGLVLGIAVGLLLIIGVRMLFAIYRRLEQRGL